MSGLGLFIWILIMGSIFFFAFLLGAQSGQRLASKFASAGTLKGKSKEDIIKAVGPPNAISGAANGGQILQWLSGGYHIVLLFDAGGICRGVIHEFSFAGMAPTEESWGGGFFR